MHSFSSFWMVIMILPCNIHSIYIFCIINRLWRWLFKVIFYLNIQGSKIGGTMDQFGGKSTKQIELRGDGGVCFFHVCPPPQKCAKNPHKSLIIFYTFSRKRGVTQPILCKICMNLEGGGQYMLYIIYCNANYSNNK